MDDWAGSQANTKMATKLKNGTRQFQKWHKTISKMVQAIFLPGAWGKIPDFMGKNHPTPPGCYGFFHTQNNPLKPDFFRRGKNFLKFLLTSFYIKSYNRITTNEKRG